MTKTRIWDLRFRFCSCYKDAFYCGRTRMSADEDFDSSFSFFVCYKEGPKIPARSIYLGGLSIVPILFVHVFE